MYTELCFYVQKVLFFYGFREISTNRTIGVSQYYGSLMKKVRGNYCILVKKDWSEIKMTKGQ